MSRFDDIIQAATGKKAQSTPVQKKTKLVTPKSPAKVTARKDKGLGAGKRKPLAKRNDKETYMQANAYIRRDTHGKVWIALIEEGKGREFSELVEGLLIQWLKDRRRTSK